MKSARKPDYTDLAALLASILFLSVLAATCRGEGEARPSGGGQSSPGSEAFPVLKIGDHVFTAGDFDKYVRSLVGPEREWLTAPALSRLFDDFVDEQLLLQAARGQNLELTAEAKQAFVDRWNRDALSQSKEAFKPGDSLDHFFDKMLVEKYLNQLVKDVNIGDQDIADYYEAHQTEFQEPVRVKVSQILLRTEAKAQEVLGRVRDEGEEEFRAAARKESIGPEAADGGRMGVFKERQLPRDMDKAVFSLQEGELSRVLKSAYGFHIFRMDKRLEAELVPLEKAAPAIRLKMLEGKVKEARDAHLRQLKETMEWSSIPGNLPFAYQKENS